MKKRDLFAEALGLLLALFITYLILMGLFHLFRPGGAFPHEYALCILSGYFQGSLWEIHNQNKRLENPED